MEATEVRALKDKEDHLRKVTAFKQEIENVGKL
jgi:hypothetical protein